MVIWGARRPEQLEPVDAITGWFIDEESKAAINTILDETITDPGGPEFMAPP